MIKIGIGLAVGLVLGFGVSHIPPILTSDSMHEHGAHDHAKLVELADGLEAPSLDFNIQKDKVAGWNLQILANNFEFSPKTVNGENEPGKGYAYIYINGKKHARVYAP